MVGYINTMLGEVINNRFVNHLKNVFGTFQDTLKSKTHD